MVRVSSTSCSIAQRRQHFLLTPTDVPEKSQTHGKGKDSENRKWDAIKYTSQMMSRYISSMFSEIGANR